MIHRGFRMRQALIFTRYGSHPAPPRIAVILALAGTCCAIGAVLAVLAVPVLALLDALLH